MIGTLVNVLAVIAGSLIGTLLRRSLPERLRTAITQGLGLCVVVIGLKDVLKTEHMLIIILSIVLGGCIGALIDIEKRLNKFGSRLQARYAKEGDDAFGRGFVSASLLFCVGAMAIVGSLNAGLRGDYGTLYAKSILDGVSAVFLAGAMGAGVLLSALSILLYQGGITLLSTLIEPILTDAMIVEMSAAGGVLILGIGLNMIRKERIPVGNLLPAVFIPLLLKMFY